jgi:hypothetical protein
MDDPLSLRDEIALVNARLADLIEREAAGESRARWRRLAAAYEQLVRQQGAGALECLVTVLESFDEPVPPDEGWADLKPWFGLKRRLVQTEARRLAWQRDRVSVDQVRMWVGELSHIVLRHVEDAGARDAILRGFDDLLMDL